MSENLNEFAEFKKSELNGSQVHTTSKGVWPPIHQPEPCTVIKPLFELANNPTDGLKLFEFFFGKQKESSFVEFSFNFCLPVLSMHRQNQNTLENFFLDINVSSGLVSKCEYKQHEEPRISVYYNPFHLVLFLHHLGYTTID